MSRYEAQLPDGTEIVLEQEMIDVAIPGFPEKEFVPGLERAWINGEPADPNEAKRLIALARQP